MYRYISLVWNEHDGRATETAAFLTAHFMGTETDWSEVYAGAGLRVLHTGEEKGRMQAYPLNTQEEDSGGVVLGKLFDRPSDPEAIPGNAELSVGEARRVIDTAGRHLVDHYWGSWVAFFQDSDKKYVLVDPIGTFCCFSTPYRGVEIYFTYMNDVAQCSFLSFEIDWIPVARQMRYGIERTETGLAEVAKILPGQCLTISRHSTGKAFYWNPQRISQTDTIENVEHAAVALRRMLLVSVAAWAAPYEKVLHQIGGLDSSIILAALNKVPTALDVTALNMFHQSPAGDERYYVRRATTHLSIPLIEYPERAEPIDSNAVAQLPPTTFPVYYAQQTAFEKDLCDLAHNHGFEAIFSGLGGDEILYATAASYGAIDFLKIHGLRPSLLTRIMEAARIQNVSVWSIIPKILYDGLSNKQWDVYREKDLGTFTLFTPEIEDLIVPTKTVHPWIKKSGNVPPGKFDHILPYTKAIYDIEVKTHPHADVRRIYPLISQPFIELCLRIPSWVMTTDGKTRGLARKSFQNYLPPEVIWRTSKASAASHHKKLLEENFTFFQEYLLEGNLATDKIIDQVSLEKTLAREHDIGNRDLGRLLLLLNAELWSRKWSEAPTTGYKSVNAA